MHNLPLHSKEVTTFPSKLKDEVIGIVEDALSNCDTDKTYSYDEPIGSVEFDGKRLDVCLDGYQKYVQNESPDVWDFEEELICEVTVALIDEDDNIVYSLKIQSV